jgi:hypothetical protein
MNKILTISITSIMAVSLLMLAISNPVLASVDPDDVFGSEKECAEKFDPEYDRENYLGCTGGIGTPNPGPGR